MKSAQSRSSRWSALFGLALGLSAGCHSGSALNQALMNDQKAALRSSEVQVQYKVGCPDVLELAIDRQPELSGRREISPDGRIEIGKLGGLRVEGLTSAEIAQAIAQLAALPPSQVHVQVADHRSQLVYIFGQVAGLQRAVPYRGPETVLDLLRRVGGLTSGAAHNQIYVVRSRVADGQQPEVFHVDLQAILTKNDDRTNLRLQPFDQIHIGETRQSCLHKCLPPCMRPIHKAVCALKPKRDE